jgi:Xaa-Pro aminopeptidase
MTSLMQSLSKVASLPVLNKISPAAPSQMKDLDLDGYLAAQSLALRSAKEVAGLMQPGWTEQRAAQLLDTCLRDYGVKAFFHRSFAWFGDRTRFAGVSQYKQFLPTGRVVRESDPVILDVAPILNGYICDIGYSFSLGPNPEMDKALAFLSELRTQIPLLFSSSQSGGAICREVDALIRKQGYDSVHHDYPFSVLGHRVHQNVTEKGPLSFLGFGWQSYWALLSRGLVGQLLNQDYEGSLQGLWAIEPHIGSRSGLGAKFEEILVVKEGSAFWLSDGERAPK